jgi:hypothetical protein
MPTLDWIGKKAVLNYHREVRYRPLRGNAKPSARGCEDGTMLDKAGWFIEDRDAADTCAQHRATSHRIPRTALRSFSCWPHRSGGSCALGKS